MVEKIKKNLPIVAVVLAIVAVVMIFCPVVNIDLQEVVNGAYAEGGIEGNIEFGISGLKTVFGWEVSYSEYDYWDEELIKETITITEFSFMNLLSYLLPIIGVVCLFMAEKKNEQKYNTYAAICFVAAAVCFFLTIPLIQYGDEMEEAKEVIEDNDYDFADYVGLGAGAIIGAIACIGAAICSYVPVMEAKKAAMPIQPVYVQPAQPVQPVQPVPQQPMYGQPRQSAQPAPQQPMYGQPQQPVQPMPQYPQYPQNGQNRPQ